MEIRSAVVYLQVAVEEHMVINMAAGTLGTLHAGCVTLVVSDLRLISDILNIAAGKPDWETQEDGNNDDDKPQTAVYCWRSHLSCWVGNAERNDGNNSNNGRNSGKGESGDRDKEREGNGEGNGGEIEEDNEEVNEKGDGEEG
ncbi:hypothetical protein HOY80DRAFT_1051963 [Tuber brumale]|nr:hypothetical protein HOY80DRAFT_1051963 [Tuber brumale]